MYNIRSHLNELILAWSVYYVRKNLCDYSHAYILVKGTITVPNTTAAGAAVNNTDKKVTFNNCAPFTDCITEMNNTQVENAQKLM